MAVFRVCVNGENFINSFEGNEIRCGFMKNEYVWAANKENAAAIARARVEKRIQQHPSLKELADIGAVLKVESIESGFSPFRLIQDEGFIFYPADENNGKDK